eukprot:TRINITY_DN1619_c0_g1_i5.p1 TRINITY_DN1619_c0_g1~~TRINITY_DN1619_c0_g1_i5.p1  ORF type:complete len:204 (-),score=93.72 TRINITY_DN1619_c0_g1_i5:75-686(-)
MAVLRNVLLLLALLVLPSSGIVLDDKPADKKDEKKDEKAVEKKEDKDEKDDDDDDDDDAKDVKKDDKKDEKKDEKKEKKDEKDEKKDEKKDEGKVELAQDADSKVHSGTPIIEQTNINVGEEENILMLRVGYESGKGKSKFPEELFIFTSNPLPKKVEAPKPKPTTKPTEPPKSEKTSSFTKKAIFLSVGIFFGFLFLYAASL